MFLPDEFGMLPHQQDRRSSAKTFTSQGFMLKLQVCQLNVTWYLILDRLFKPFPSNSGRVASLGGSFPKWPLPRGVGQSRSAFLGWKERPGGGGLNPIKSHGWKPPPDVNLELEYVSPKLVWFPSWKRICFFPLHGSWIHWEFVFSFD